MEIDHFEQSANDIFDLHIQILRDILIKKPLEIIKEEYQKEIKDTNYFEVIKKSGHLCFNDQDELIGAYPVSPIKTDYLVKLESAGEGNSMCAIDALGLAYTFLEKTIIKSKDKSTGNDIEIVIDPFSENQEIHDLYVTYQDTPEELQGSNTAAQVQCPTINFYSSKKDIPQNLQIWTFSKALEYSQMRFGRREMLARIQKAINSIND